MQALLVARRDALKDDGLLQKGVERALVTSCLVQYKWTAIPIKGHFRRGTDDGTGRC